MKKVNFGYPLVGNLCSIRWSVNMVKWRETKKIKETIINQELCGIGFLEKRERWEFEHDFKKKKKGNYILNWLT